MKTELELATFKLVAKLLDLWISTGDDKYILAVKEILTTMKGLK